MATSQPTAAKPVKLPSSRLLNMKFMQRAAAVANDTAGSSIYLPSPKRRKVGATAQSGSATDQLLKAAVASEELKRTEAIERQAERAGETRWFLSFQDESQGAMETGSSHSSRCFQVIQTGFASIDEISSGSGQKDGKLVQSKQARGVGRMNFGNFSHASKEDTSTSTSGDDDASSDLDVSSHRALDADSLIEGARDKAARRSKRQEKAERKAAKAAAAQAKENIEKPIKLSRLTSISGTGARESASPNVECYNCGARGHMARMCTNQARKAQPTKKNERAHVYK
ncbi:MAG: hypothetical protein M1816_002569 [Peltula sp. TS41687]|nr:MAG: hypothetical protein M1816_002569 [Peltula sp. TS41687]